MRRLKSSIVQQTTRPIVALAFMPAPPGSCRASSLLDIFTAYSLTGNQPCLLPSNPPNVSTTRPPAKTTLSRPPRLLPNSLGPRSHPLFPLFAHREMVRRISPTNCHSTILLPSCLLPDAGSLACTGAGQFPVCKSLVLCQNVQTQNHIPFPLQNRK